ncbi:hypothetical protein D3C87_1724600 [compost metagenome]|uniref:Uncharacterized protein n=1 Tax=Agrobacterium deltaense Zutra 3/1 TaxID=1183427 RepID=A0A1S7QQF6_9HYPH|nr:hypothetical protein [Agrobacterium deltaense]CUX40477.1 hypothetical protein AGR7C_Lc100032 [Agrobacterium deltaense Zutra 3/1]
MSKIYVAAEGCAIPGGWPEGGRPIDPLSRQHRRMIETGDLVEKEQPAETPAEPVKPSRKD